MECFARLQAQQQLSAAPGAGMLREQENAGLRPFGSRAIAKPCGQRHARSIFRRDTAHIQDEGAEASSLQEKVRDTERLLDAWPRPGDESRLQALLHDRLLRIRLKGFFLQTDTTLRFCAARSERLWLQQAAYRIR